MSGGLLSMLFLKIHPALEGKLTGSPVAAALVRAVDSHHLPEASGAGRSGRVDRQRRLGDNDPGRALVPLGGEVANILDLLGCSISAIWRESYRGRYGGVFLKG